MTRRTTDEGGRQASLGGRRSPAGRGCLFPDIFLRGAGQPHPHRGARDHQCEPFPSCPLAVGAARSLACLLLAAPPGCRLCLGRPMSRGGPSSSGLLCKCAFAVSGGPGPRVNVRAGGAAGSPGAVSSGHWPHGAQHATPARCCSPWCALLLPGGAVRKRGTLLRLRHRVRKRGNHSCDCATG